MIGYKMFKVGTFIQKFKMGSKLLSKFKICKIDCRARNPAWASFFLNLCHSLPIHSSFLSFQYCCSVFKFCRWPNSNRRLLMSEPTALPNWATTLPSFSFRFDMRLCYKYSTHRDLSHLLIWLISMTVHLQYAVKRTFTKPVFRDPLRRRKKA